MFFPSFIILSVARQLPSFVLFSERCSIIMLYLIGLDLSKQTPLDAGRWERRREEWGDQHGRGTGTEGLKPALHVPEGFHLKLLVAT